MYLNGRKLLLSGCNCAVKRYKKAGSIASSIGSVAFVIECCMERLLHSQADEKRCLAVKPTVTVLKRGSRSSILPDLQSFHVRDHTFFHHMSDYVLCLFGSPYFLFLSSTSHSRSFFVPRLSFSPPLSLSPPPSLSLSLSLFPSSSPLSASGLHVLIFPLCTITISSSHDVTSSIASRRVSDGRRCRRFCAGHL